MAKIGIRGSSTGGGGGTPGGATTNVQYNDAGVFGGDANNTWNKTTKLQTFTQNALGLTSTDVLHLRNTTAAAAGSSNQQVSPRLVLEGQGWKTLATAASQSVKMGMFVQPTQSTSFPFGTLNIQRNINAGGWVTLLSITTGDSSELTTASMGFSGKTALTHNNNNGTPNVSDILTLTNSTGTFSHQKWTFSTVVKASTSVSNQGSVTHRAVGVSPTFNFNVGSSLGSDTLISQIYGSGYYSNYNAYIGGVVTAGSADTATTTKLSAYGSFAVKGTVVTSALYQVLATDSNLYIDPKYATVCTGTPSVTACTSYVGSGQSVCESHLPCVWLATDCSAFGGVDQDTCETGHPGCTFDSLACSGADNSDSTTCEDQDNTYGGGCSWDTSTCSSLSDGGGDGTACATEPRCSYDSGSGTCSGNLCQGTYFNGVCSGSWDTCTGTVTCTGYQTSGTCVAETGCSFVTGNETTLPQASAANRSNTARLHTFVHVGDTGFAKVSAFSGDDIFGFESIVLRTRGDRVSLHHTNATGACSQFTSQGVCEAQSPCVWQLAVVCASLVDQTSCEGAPVSAGCSWDTDLLTCSGAGSPAQCIGTYTVVNAWVPYNVERTGFTQTATGTVTNTTTETALTAAGKGSLDFPGGFFRAGSRLQIKGFGIHSAVVTGTLTVRIKFGSTVILTTGAITSGVDTNGGFELDADITFRTVGASGTLFAQGEYHEEGAIPTTFEMVNTATTTLDTTALQTLSVTAQWSTASTSRSISLTNLQVKIDDSFL